MTIDARGRAATADLRRATTQEVDPMTMLTKLERTSRARTRNSVVAALAAVVVVVAGVIFMAHSPQPSQPISPAGTNPSSSRVTDNCPGGPITCLGGNRYRVALVVPLTVTVPPNFQGQLTNFGTNSTSLEDYRNDTGRNTGVTVLENAVPVKNDASWTRDTAAGTSALSVADWLAHRPFAFPTRVTTTTVGGRVAYQVSLVLKPGAPLVALHGSDRSAPTFAGQNTEMAAWGQLQGRYTLLDVPGAGVTVIWSWTYDKATVLAGNQAFVHGLSFG